MFCLTNCSLRAKSNQTDAKLLTSEIAILQMNRTLVIHSIGLICIDFFLSYRFSTIITLTVYAISQSYYLFTNSKHAYGLLSTLTHFLSQQNSSLFLHTLSIFLQTLIIGSLFNYLTTRKKRCVINQTIPDHRVTSVNKNRGSRKKQNTYDKWNRQLWIR